MKFPFQSTPTTRGPHGPPTWLLLLVLLFPAAAFADDVLLLLPKNFDVTGIRGWASNSYSGRTELTPDQAKVSLLKFRGNRVTADDSRTDQVTGRGGGTTFIHYETRIEATYDKGRLSGTYEHTSKNWNQGYPADSGIPNREYSRSTLKGTISGQADANGILTVFLQVTDHAVFQNLNNAGWTKIDVPPDLFSWCIDYQLPVGELQSAQTLSEVKKDSTLATQLAADDDITESPSASDSPPDDTTVEVATHADLSPAEVAAASTLAGGAALLGALSLMGATDVGRDDVIQAIRDLIRSEGSIDSFTQWKQKYESLGWRYTVTDGIATFEPVEGCRNAEGLVWSAQQGAFVNPSDTPASPTVAATPKEGDINERGEVWSSLSGGYVDRKLYEQDLASREAIARAARLEYDDNPYVREAREAHTEASQAHLDSQLELVRKNAELLSLNLRQLQEKEAASRYYTKERDEFFKTIRERAERVLREGTDPEKMAAELDAINNMVERQARPSFEPQLTTQDKIEDGIMRGVATAADMTLTGGGMNALVTGFQTARDGVIEGISEGEAITRGVIQGAAEAGTAAIGHLAGQYGMNQAATVAGANAASEAAVSFRDQIEQGRDPLDAAARAIGDGAFAGGTSFVTDTATDIAKEKASTVLKKAPKGATTSGSSPADTAVPPVP